MNLVRGIYNIWIWIDRAGQQKNAMDECNDVGVGVAVREDLTTMMMSSVAVPNLQDCV